MYIYIYIYIYMHKIQGKYIYKYTRVFCDQALNRENPGSNPLAAVSKLWQFHSSHVDTVHLAV